jgi:hypothetical protein
MIEVSSSMLRAPSPPIDKTINRYFMSDGRNTHSSMFKLYYGVRESKQYVDAFDGGMQPERKK